MDEAWVGYLTRDNLQFPLCSLLFDFNSTPPPLRNRSPGWRSHFPTWRRADSDIGPALDELEGVDRPDSEFELVPGLATSSFFYN